MTVGGRQGASAETARPSELLDGLRVLEFSDEIAGPYCGKLMADAGADVIKVEPESGDPLRRWSASGLRPEGTDGALFRYLNGGKRSATGSLGDPHIRRLLEDCALILDSGQLSQRDIDEIRNEHPSVVVASVTPFGRSGPWADLPATEFTLQAVCGSTGGRGTADREPLFAGGRLGEWIAGVYTAVAALAATRAARLSGEGDDVDVSMLECMSITMGGYASLGQSLGLARPAGPSRTVELPSIEPSADGYVGFCTITGQQFQDFLVLIERPDLLGDAHLASFVGRQSRRVEFLEMVAKWTTQRTTSEIIDLASALRIPVAPIGTPETIPEIDQFVERSVFVRSADDTFVQPRVPYIVDGVAHRGPRLAPTLGADTGHTWLPAGAPPPSPKATVSGRRLPLAGIRVVDLTAFWAGPAASQVLAILGADVIKIESTTRPDGMRMHSSRPMSEAGWWEWSSVFQAANVNKRDLTLDLTREDGRALLMRLVRESDVVIENYSPRVLDNFGITWDAVRAVNPSAVMVRMPAFGLDGPWRDRTGFAQTMEQVTGMAWMTGFRDGPALIPRGPCDPLAGMHAVFAVLAALEDRDRTGAGHFVESTMVEAALNVAAEVVIERTAYGALLARDGNRGPVSAPQGLYQCAGDDNWVAIAVRTDHQWMSLGKALGLGTKDVAARAHEADRRRDHDAIDDLLIAACGPRDAEELVETLLAAGVPAAVVREPADVVENPQMRARGFVETIDHSLLGRHDLLGAPFRYRSREGGWVFSPAPMLGQHNVEILSDVLGMSRSEIERLEADGMIGTALTVH
ncbi:MAG: CoA transferase [Acidimicrobiia bacterium]